MEKSGLCPTHPVCGLSWEDAQAFCQWLTELERTKGKLTATQSYRLPTHAEWNAVVGSQKYPWGDQWPPPPGAGNYPGPEAKDADWPAHFQELAGYRDAYARTSPVGSFTPNQLGLYDMGGNLWQWSADWNDDAARNSRMLHGAAWDDFVPANLISSICIVHPISTRGSAFGFPVVLVTGLGR